MSTDERAIRDLIDTWLTASAAGDIAKVLTLMTDDVVFMTPGREPFGKAAFEASSRQMSEKGTRFEAKSQIVELQVNGAFAFCRTRLEVTGQSPAGSANRRTGYTMSILQKGQDGSWRIARDANLLA